MAVDLNCEASAGSPHYSAQKHQHLPDAILSDCPDDCSDDDAVHSPVRCGISVADPSSNNVTGTSFLDNDDDACPKKRSRPSRKDPAVRVPIGTRVRVLWPRDGQWHPGRVTKFDSKKALHTISIDRGETKRLDLRVVPWSLAVEGALHLGSAHVPSGGHTGNVHLGSLNGRYVGGAYNGDDVAFSSSQYSCGAPWQMQQQGPCPHGVQPHSAAPITFTAPPAPGPPPLRLELPRHTLAPHAPYSAHQPQGQATGNHGQYGAPVQRQVMRQTGYQQQPLVQQQQPPQYQQQQQQYYSLHDPQYQAHQFPEHQQPPRDYPPPLVGVAAQGGCSGMSTASSANTPSCSPPALLHIPASVSAPPATVPPAASGLPCPCCHNRMPPAPLSPTPASRGFRTRAPPPTALPHIAPGSWGEDTFAPVPVREAAGCTMERRAYAEGAGAQRGCAHHGGGCGAQICGPRSGLAYTCASCEIPHHSCGNNLQGHVTSQHVTSQTQQYVTVERGASHPQCGRMAEFFPSPAITQAQCRGEVARASLPQPAVHGAFDSSQRHAPLAVGNGAAQRENGREERGYGKSGGAVSDSCSDDGRRAAMVWPVSSEEMKMTSERARPVAAGAMGEMRCDPAGGLANAVGKGDREGIREGDDAKDGDGHCMRKRTREWDADAVGGEGTLVACGAGEAAAVPAAASAPAAAAGAAAKGVAKEEVREEAKGKQEAECDMEAVALILAVAHQLQDDTGEQQGTRQEDAQQQGDEEEGMAEGAVEDGEGGEKQERGVTAAAAAGAAGEGVESAGELTGGARKPHCPSSCSSGRFPPPLLVAPVAPKPPLPHPPATLSGSSESESRGCDHGDGECGGRKWCAWDAGVGQCGRLGQYGMKQQQQQGHEQQMPVILQQCQESQLLHQHCGWHQQYPSDNQQQQQSMVVPVRSCCNGHCCSCAGHPGQPAPLAAAHLSPVTPPRLLDPRATGAGLHSQQQQHQNQQQQPVGSVHAASVAAASPSMRLRLPMALFPKTITTPCVLSPLCTHTPTLLPRATKAPTPPLLSLPASAGASGTPTAGPIPLLSLPGTLKLSPPIAPLPASAPSAESPVPRNASPCQSPPPLCLQLLPLRSSPPMLTTTHRTSSLVFPLPMSLHSEALAREALSRRSGSLSFQQAGSIPLLSLPPCIPIPSLALHHA